jgi:uncharacterized membrane protein YjjB (DUF3815 family)
MKKIMSRLIPLVPGIAVLMIMAYIVEEILEDTVSEQVSDFVYPITALGIVALLWFKLMPVVREYLAQDSQSEERIGGEGEVKE